MQDVAELRREVAQVNKEFARFKRRYKELQAEFEENMERFHRTHGETGDFWEKGLISADYVRRSEGERCRREAKRPKKRDALWRK